MKKQVPRIDKNWEEIVWLISQSINLSKISKIAEIPMSVDPMLPKAHRAARNSRVPWNPWVDVKGVLILEFEAPVSNPKPKIF